MERICGIDVSSFGVDLCFIAADPKRDEVAPPFWIDLDLGWAGDAFDRARLVRSAYDNYQTDWLAIWAHVVAIGIEQPYGKGLLSTAAGYRIQGAIIACLPSEHVLYPMGPTTWKATCGIGGGAKKPAIRAWFESGNSGLDLGDGSRTEDELDSCGVALATRHDFLKTNPVS